MHVADTLTGEQVELDPLRRMSVHEIYSKITANFAKKDEAARLKALNEMQAQMGVKVETALPASATNTESTEPISTTEAEEALRDFMRQLAEDIYDALEKCQKSLAIIKPESIGSKVTSHLTEKGDANFLVAAGEGPALLESLRQQDNDMRLVRENDYGFVLENEQLGFRAMFIFQDRLGDATGQAA